MARRPAVKPPAALKDYDETYLACRDLRHPWRVLGAYWQGSEARRVLECPRCGMTRNDRWGSDGTRHPSSYNAPTGYRVNDGGVTTTEVRLAVLSRIKVYTSHDEMIEASLNGHKNGKTHD